MIRENLKQSALLTCCITAIGFIGDAFNHFTPIWLYLSPAGLDQIFIRLVFWWMVATVIFFIPIYYGTNAKLGLIRRACCLTLASLFVVLLFNGLFKIADIKPSELLPPIVDKNSSRVFYLTIFFSIFAILVLLKLTDRQILRIANTAKVTALIFFALLAYRVYDSNFPLRKPEISHNISQIKSINQNLEEKKRRVIFIVFDEFDPSIAFSSDDSNIDLPNFQRLIQQSFYAPNALPPAKSTAESIPAMLIGTATSGNLYGNKNNLYVKASKEKLIEFSQSNAIFSKIPGGPQSMAIMGFYHPYCKIFKIEKCISFPYHNFPIEPTSLSSLLPRSITGELRNSHQLLAYTTEKQLELLPFFLNDKSKNLIYIHLNIPHLEAHYAAKVLGRNIKKTSDENYELNLQLSDEILGTAMEIIRQTQSEDENVLLILCSDHWFRNTSRPRDDSNGLPALLIIKSLSDDSPVLYQSPLSTHHLPELSVDFLNGKITKNMEIKNWFKEKPVYKTYIGGSKWVDE